MGRFKCSSCDRDYVERRFLWEQESENESTEGDSNREVEFVADASVSRLGCKVKFPELNIIQVDEGSWADAAGIRIGCKIIAVNGVCTTQYTKEVFTEKPYQTKEIFLASLKSRPLRLRVMVSAEGQGMNTPTCSPLASNDKNDTGDAFLISARSALVRTASAPAVCKPQSQKAEQGDGAPMEEGNPAHRRASLGPYADAVRAMGTMANVTGSIAPALAYAVAPVSAVGGVCGTVGGVYQLIEGVYTPSGKIDPHLVAKGGVTASVGTTCASLGFCAAMAPLAAGPLLLSAFGLGLAGLATATCLDANMNGLCHDCRENCGKADVDADATGSDTNSD